MLTRFVARKKNLILSQINSLESQDTSENDIQHTQENKASLCQVLKLHFAYGSAVVVTYAAPTTGSLRRIKASPQWLIRGPYAGNHTLVTIVMPPYPSRAI